MAPTAGPSRQNQKHRKTKQVRGGSLDSDAVLGVQKIKSALRQTRRLLAKVFIPSRSLPSRGVKLRSKFIVG